MKFEELKIKQEDELRKEFENLPEVKQFAKENRQKIESVEESYNFGLRSSVALTEKSHESLFHIINELKKKFDIKQDIKVLKKKDTQSILENATIIGDNKLILIEFYNDILSLMNDPDELRFIIGHEIGHFLYGHTKSTLSIEFINHYTNIMTNGDTISQKILRIESFNDALNMAHVLSQINELNADRIGLLTSKNFEKSVIAAMKLAAGYEDSFGTFDIKSYIEQAESIMKQDFVLPDDFNNTHPLEPLRVYALDFFHKSESFSGKNKLQDFSEILPYIVPIDLIKKKTKDIKKASSSKPQLGIDQFDKELFKLISGYFVANADGKISKKETELLSNFIRDDEYFTKANSFIAEASDSDFENKFSELSKKMKQLSNREKSSIIRSLIKLAKSDRKISKEEIEEIKNISKEFDAELQCKTEFKNKLGLSI